MTIAQHLQVGAYIEANSRDGYPSTLYQRKRDVLLATDHETGRSRVIIYPNGDFKPLGSGPVDKGWREVMAYTPAKCTNPELLAKCLTPEGR